MQTQFVQWQNLYIESLKYGAITINQAIRYFIKDGLNPLLQKNGYIFEVNDTVIENIIASMMFKSRYNKLYSFPTRENIYYDEYFQHFEYIINEDDWRFFFIFWNRMLDNIFYGFIPVEIKCISWMFIHMKKSISHIQYLESFEESDKEQNNTTDPHLLDQMNPYSNDPKFVFEK